MPTILPWLALLSCWQIAVLHSELKTMREFRRKRAELQEQLETMQQALGDAHHTHEQQVTSLEHKYFEEKASSGNQSTNPLSIIKGCSFHKHYQANPACVMSLNNFCTVSISLWQEIFPCSSSLQSEIMHFLELEHLRFYSIRSLHSNYLFSEKNLHVHVVDWQYSHNGTMHNHTEYAVMITVSSCHILSYYIQFSPAPCHY